MAHAGHWLVSVIYLAPLAVLVIVVVVGKLRDRRGGADREEGDSG